MNNDFTKFALCNGVNHNGLLNYTNAMGYVNPNVLEERELRVTSIDIFSRLMMDRTIFLGTEINDDVANIVVAQLLWLDQQSDSDITIICNTPGGSVYDGYAIIDTMQFIGADVSTNVVGLAASMGAVIASSGVKGKRYILPHSRFMIHQPLSGMSGYKQASDIEIQSKEINKLKDEVYTTLSQNSNLTKKQIEKMSDRDMWMTATEAVENGFVDIIINKDVKRKK